MTTPPNPAPPTDRAPGHPRPAPTAPVATDLAFAIATCLGHGWQVHDLNSRVGILEGHEHWAQLTAPTGERLALRTGDDQPALVRIFSEPPIPTGDHGTAQAYSGIYKLTLDLAPHGLARCISDLILPAQRLESDRAAAHLAAATARRTEQIAWQRSLLALHPRTGHLAPTQGQPADHDVFGLYPPLDAPGPQATLTDFGGTFQRIEVRNLNRAQTEQVVALLARFHLQDTGAAE